MEVHRIDASTVIYTVPGSIESVHDDDTDRATTARKTGGSILSIPGSSITTLTSGGTTAHQGVSGFAYIPSGPGLGSCLASAPNATDDALVNSTFDAIAFAPWISANCSTNLLNIAASDPSNLRGFMFYTPNTTTVAGASAHIWAGVNWTNYNFPVFAIPGTDAAPLMTSVASYVRNVSYDTGEDFDGLNETTANYARAYIEVNAGSGASLPGLWIFLVTVVIVAIAVIVTVSLAMHLVQRRRRGELQRRIEAGELNAERLMGTWVPTVPEDVLKTIPIKRYSQRPSMADPETDNTAAPGPPSAALMFLPPDPPLPPDPISRIPSTAALSTLSVYSANAGYDQPSCAICLESFVAPVAVRVLPCDHIFHPHCVDRHLTTISAECPLCKRSAMPAAPRPVKVDNRMLRRWRELENQEAITRTRSAPWGSLGGGGVFLGWRPRGLTEYFHRRQGEGAEAGAGPRSEAGQEMRQMEAGVAAPPAVVTRQTRETDAAVASRNDSQRQAEEGTGGPPREPGKLRQVVNRVFPGF